jgi:hypothetical protein
MPTLLSKSAFGSRVVATFVENRRTPPTECKILLPKESIRGPAGPKLARAGRSGESLLSKSVVSASQFGQNTTKHRSFTIRKKCHARHSAAEWAFMVLLATKSMRFAMEKVLHARHSAAECQLLMSEAPKVTKMPVFYRRKKMSRSPLRSGMVIYGPDRDQMHVFCGAKRVARSPLRSQTSVLDTPTPAIVVSCERGEHFFVTLPFCTRGTSLFGPMWVRKSKTRHFTREVQRFFERPCKTPTITDENVLPKPAGGQIYPRETTRRPGQEPQNIHNTPVITEANRFLEGSKKKKGEAHHACAQKCTSATKCYSKIVRKSMCFLTKNASSERLAN